MVLQNKKVIYLSSLLFGVLGSIITLFFLFFYNWSALVESYHEFEGTFVVIMTICIRIIIISIMAIYTFYNWFKQEEQYFSDMPFLFGMFFLLLVFGKILDLFIDFSYHYLNRELLLFVMKARYFVAIFDLLPMMYLSIYMILISLSVKKRFNKLANENYLNKMRIWILGIIITIELIVCIFILTIENAPIIYPITILPSLIAIVWLFNFAWRNQRLSQVNNHILMIGFGLYLITSILRPLLQIIFGPEPSYVIIAETLDIIIFMIIFIGFYKKSNYSQNQ